MAKTAKGYPKGVAYIGSRGNIREIHPTGSPERPYEARFDGATLGYYFNENDAYTAIQEALATKLQESKR